MATGQKAFNKFQMSNPENTPGTIEAAVEVLLGNFTAPVHDRVKHVPEQDRGLLAMNVELPFDISKEVELEMEGELYDRIAVWQLSNAIRGNVTPTQPDAVNQPLTYEWLFEPGLTTGNTPDIANGIDTFTLEYGDNVQAYAIPYTFTTNLTITGTVNEPVEFSWTVMGQQVVEQSFTAALTAAYGKYFAFNNASFFIDADYASIGTTQSSCSLRAFEWSFDTMFTARYAANGDLYFCALNEEPKKVELELTFYRSNEVSEVEFDKFLNDQINYIRIALESSGEMDVGESNPPYLYLDGAFIYTEWPEYEDEDGTNVITVNAESWYDPTASKSFGVTVGTTLAAFP